MSVYTSWYREGSVSITNNNSKVTGTRTYWTTAGIHPGDIFKVKDIDYEVSEVVNDTTIQLVTPIKSTSGNNLEYAVIRNFTASMSTEIAAQTIQLLGKFTRYIDADMEKVQGKSAYDLAKEEGFTGTLTQWLDSLKAANEWTELDERTKILAGRTAGLHNSLYRGYKLGEAVTPEIMAAIREGSYKNLWLGDYLSIGRNTYMIAHFGYFNSVEDDNHNPLRSKPHVVLLLSPGYLYDSNGAQIKIRWSDTSEIVPEGGYLASDLAAAYEDEGVIMKQIEADLGADNLHQFMIRTCSSFVNGECKEYTSKLVKACPPTERQLFGEKVYGIEDRDSYNGHMFAAGLVARNYCPGTWGMKPLREIAGDTSICTNDYGKSTPCRPNGGAINEVQFMCVLA